jgi:hypothetical protein
MTSRKWSHVGKMKGIEDDLAFLGEVRAATVSTIESLAKRFHHKGAPSWKKVAIARAQKRLGLIHDEGQYARVERQYKTLLATGHKPEMRKVAVATMARLRRFTGV